MEEIRIWNILFQPSEKAQAMPVPAIAETATEQLLEDVLAASPELLMPNLRLIGRQTETSGGPLDLLGIDEDGRLVVFELKRGNLTRDAVAQAIDYASFLAGLEIDDLCRHLSASSTKCGVEPIEDFAEWYQSHYARSVTDIGRPRIVLVGLGVDERAKRMVAFLAQVELDISLLTFHGFQHGGDTLLARQIEVQSHGNSSSVKSTKHDNLVKLNGMLVNLGIKEQFEGFVAAVKRSLDDAAYQWPNAVGYSYYLPEVSASGGPTTRAYLSVNWTEKHKGKVLVLLQARAIEAIGEEALAHFAAAFSAHISLKPSGYAEILIDAHTPASVYCAPIDALGKAILAGWKSKVGQQNDAESNAVES